MLNLDVSTSTLCQNKRQPRAQDNSDLQSFLKNMKKTERNYEITKTNQL